MLLLQGMKHQQDQKWDKELETEPERVALLPLSTACCSNISWSPCHCIQISPYKPRAGTAFTGTGRRNSGGLAVPHTFTSIDLCCEFWHLFWSCSKKMFNGSMVSVM